MPSTPLDNKRKDLAEQGRNFQPKYPIGTPTVTTYAGTNAQKVWVGYPDDSTMSGYRMERVLPEFDVGTDTLKIVDLLPTILETSMI